MKKVLKMHLWKSK